MFMVEWARTRHRRSIEQYLRDEDGLLDETEWDSVW